MKLTCNSLFIASDRCAIGLTDGRNASVRWIERPNPDSRAAGTPAGDETDARMRAMIDAVRDEAGAAGARFGPLVLGLPSDWCFAATIPTDGLLRHHRRQGLLHRLEEKLPADLETWTADYAESDGQAFAVAAVNAKVRPWLDALDQAGLTVAHVCPTALLLAESLIDAPPRDKAQAASGSMICHSHLGTDIVGWQDSAITHWRHHPTTPTNELTDEVTESFATQHRSDAAIYLITPQQDDDVQEPPDATDQGTDGLKQSHLLLDDALASSADHLSKLLRQGRPPRFDLARDALAGQGLVQRLAAPLRVAGASVLILLLAVGGAAHWRAHQTNERLAAANDQLEAIYRDAFHGQSVPTAIVSRLRSEAVKARGVAGTDRQLPPSGTVRQDLADLMRGLPDDLRFRLLEIRLEPERVYLDGQARTHADADRIAAGLRDTLDYTLHPPRTQNLVDRDHSASHHTSDAYPGGGGGGGVSWVISGERDRGSP